MKKILPMLLLAAGCASVPTWHYVGTYTPPITLCPACKSQAVYDGFDRWTNSASGLIYQADYYVCIAYPAWCPWSGSVTNQIAYGK